MLTANVTVRVTNCWNCPYLDRTDLEGWPARPRRVFCAHPSLSRRSGAEEMDADQLMEENEQALTPSCPIIQEQNAASRGYGS